ncbi:MAG: hypothetical protein KDD92_13810 [Caldilineaceae bacterium]|nr:hypothetical protein [Caldilineaceae bacterium]
MSIPTSNWTAIVVAIIGAVAVVLAAVLAYAGGQRNATIMIIEATKTAEAKLATPTSVEKVQRPTSTPVPPTNAPVPTSTPVPPTSTPFPTSTPQPTATDTPLLTPINTRSSVNALCYGNCWDFNDSTRTMTWTGSGDGVEDIWQPSGDALQKIRNGYTAIINPTVPGEIFACVLNVNGEFVKNNCDDVLFQTAPGPYQITSANLTVGGFRWCPALGYGYRKNGDVCK